MPSDNSLLVRCVINECSRCNNIVPSAEFDFHLMGIHISAFSNEELVFDDVLGCQLGDASSAVFTFLHRSFLLSCLSPNLGAGALWLLPKVPPRISIALEDAVALALDHLVLCSPEALGFSLAYVVSASCLGA